MWQNLKQLQEIDSTLPLDPSDVKRAMLLAEKSHTLFNLGNLPVLYNEDLRIGQQDCREFFYCINENRESWPDVFNFFKVSTLSETECCNCGNISRQEVSANERTLISLPCPTSTVNMKDYLEGQLNGFELVENWRDENGCGEIVNGRSKTKISNINETDYVVFMLERLLEFDGQLQIMKTKVIVNPQEKVNLIDIDGRTGKFLPLAIIHHSGGIIEQTTYGHYQADVINRVTQTWFRTSDNDQPKELDSSQLTKSGYIFLYKKIKERDIKEDDEGIPCINLDGGASIESSIDDEVDELGHIIRLLDEMNLDLVFHDFEELKIWKISWLHKFVFEDKRVKSTVSRLGRKMLFYSSRVNLEIVYLLTDLLFQCPETYIVSLVYNLIDENILDGLRLLLSTTCFLTIRSVLIFGYKIALHTQNDFSRILLSIKLKDKIEWLAEQRIPMNYLSNPSISNEDKVIEERLKPKNASSSIKETHDLAKKVLEIITKQNGD